ncbi:DUF2442 domain-containing protein [Acetobacterium wieringae]|uniref:DUF2442 domain-containing protein n=1 Tax=Acetobacterium wieringae TaxID=52694 RepID=UPI002B1FD703|nr:DUF2442 domain-containing protein [Acetobacterium wieringae]MEA4805526.1 DUF2442 domain-containing protein [Acetobacterium wieringae]
MYEIDGVLYAGKPANMIKVTGVKILQNYQLLLTFSTGERKLYDVSPLLVLPVFQSLKDVSVFEDVQLDFDTVSWCNGDVDIAPETLYQDSVDISEAI